MSWDTCVHHGKVDSSRWKITPEGKFCAKCFKSKRLRAGFITGASPRVREDQARCERELIQPFKGGKPNPDFLKEYPSQAPDYFDQKELDRMGAEKLKSTKKKEFKGDDRPEEPPGVEFVEE
jgi:hypothetical protein